MKPSLALETQHALGQKRSQAHVLFHLEVGQTDTPINHAPLGVGQTQSPLPSTTRYARVRVPQGGEAQALLEQVLAWKPVTAII